MFKLSFRASRNDEGVSLIVTGNQNGSAAILTLLISAIMITVAIGFNWIVKEHLAAAEGLKTKTEAMVEAKSVYDALIYSISRGKLGRSEIVLSGGENFLGVDKLPLGGQGLTLKNDINIIVRDSSSLLSIVSMNTDVLKRLSRLLGGTEPQTAHLTDSYIDWIDVDDLSRINGAEAYYYSSEGKAYKPRNFSMQYKEELGLIRGMESGVYKKIEPYLTMLPSFGFNPNTADDIMLMAYLDINKDTLAVLKDFMLKQPVVSDVELFQLTNRMLVKDDGMYYYPSPYLDITIKVGKPKAVYTLNTGVDIRRKENSPYSVIYWKE